MNYTTSLFIKSILVLALITMTACMGRSNSTEKRPNLLIIHTDEQTFRSVSCYENSWPDLQTPNIDSLASMGARFENYYTNHPVCTPSRAALLTGKYAHDVGSYYNDIPLDPDALTFGDILQEHNYVTGYAGKLHLAGGPYPGLALERKFGFDDNRYMFNNAHMKKLTLGETGNMESPGGIGDEETYATDFLTDRTMEFIGENQGKDWCYMVSFPDPHDPNTERPPYDTMFKPEDMKIPPTFQLPEGTKQAWEPNLSWKDQWKEYENVSDLAFLKEHKARYFGMVKHIDDCVGRLIDHLRENGLWENTIVVFNSDHGDMMGEFSTYNKGSYYEASAKIPFIICYPTKIRSNTVVEKLVSNIDFVPTVLDLMDIPFESESFDGASAESLLSGQGDDKWKNIVFLSLPSSVAVLTERYNLCLRLGKQPWLIDRTNDPEEMENALHGKYDKDEVRMLALQLQNYLETESDPNWTDSLTRIYNERYYQHKNFRKPAIQRARRTEITWRTELDKQISSLLD